ncbi:MAG: hypothetical protein AAF497_26780 [Planctomycetota bacterium]
MNERERWIVYPLIFFLLLLVTRDNILKTQEVKCNRLVCNKLYVQTEDGRELVKIFGSYDRGIMSFYGPVEGDIDDERWTESANTNLNAKPMVQIGVQTGGGFANFYGRPDAPTLKIGHHEDLAASGLMATNGSKGALSSEAADYDGIWGTTVLWDQPENATSDEDGKTAVANGSESTPGTTPDATTDNDATKAVEPTGSAN